ncbi:hypothetical protein ACU5P1_15410 [Pseudomonas plecoglossicida]|uniref:Uncharacterized protein n=1 Tax=Pseudomonas plecoglossicida TaxID=70775 RepID=A0AAD0QTL5_PSEDL|nr:hypothetical protein [Pseudomonas plecoglossicida]AXM95333.1 hypothetical protein DVB73_05700 [Pseudomonas plecoglossicida]QLB56082.1 hypothetical protein HAV28_15245 [Pseudomonas plecoglossicida]
MECKKGTSAMLEWRSRFLTTGSLEEDQYDQALSSAEALEPSGLISSTQWVELVKAANAALLRVR